MAHYSTFVCNAVRSFVSDLLAVLVAIYCCGFKLGRAERCDLQYQQLFFFLKTVNADKFYKDELCVLSRENTRNTLSLAISS